MKKELNKIIRDNSSGSVQILLRLIEYLKKNINNVNEIMMVCQIVKSELSHFAVIKKFISELENKIDNSSPEKILQFILLAEHKQRNSAELIYYSNKKIFDSISSFSTISFSKTLLEIVKIWMKETTKLEAFVLESRPIFEGRKFASKISKLNVKTTLTVDCMMAEVVINSDAVFIGADQILKNGNVVNKIGSYPLALCAKELQIPFYVVASKDKFINKIKFSPKSQSPSEIWQTKKEIRIMNNYFEEVPNHLITKILTD